MVLSTLQTTQYSEMAMEKLLRIMVVEDLEGMRKLVCSILELLGYVNVVAANNGSEAWERMQSENIDLLLTDMRMPDMGGIELVEKMRQQPHLQLVPALMFSATEDAEQVRAAFAAGVNSFLKKPFSPPQLRAKLDEVLDKHFEHLVNEIVEGAGVYPKEAKMPLVVIGEDAVSKSALRAPHRRRQVYFLWQALKAIDHINATDEEIELGYDLRASSSDITTLLRARKDRVKMLIVSATLSGGMTLVRLASFNREKLKIVLVCESIKAVPLAERRALQKQGVFVVERDEMPMEHFERLLREFVVAQSYAPARDELPSQEEIQRRIEADISNMVSLPVLPILYQQITRLDEKSTSDIRKWAECIERDPLASAMIVRRARTPIYGFHEEITHVQRAVVMLGKSDVRDTILCQTVKQAFEHVKEKGFSVEEFWLHSLAVGLTASILGGFAGKTARNRAIEKELAALRLNADFARAIEPLNLRVHFALDPGIDLFAAGVMHDIGKAAMVASYPGLYPEIIRTLQEHDWQIPMLEAENLVAGPVNHEIVGQLLARSWGLSNEVDAVVGRHHKPSKKERLALLVALANFVAGALYPFPSQANYPSVELLREGAERTPQKLEAAAAFLPPALLELLKLSVDQLLDITTALAPEIKRITEEWRHVV